MSTSHSRGLLVIAGFKILKGLLLLAVGLGALHLLHRNIAAELGWLVDLLRVDPHNHYLHRLLEKIANVDPKVLREFSVGTMLYAGLFLCEGIGLALRRRWAEYLTIVSTASLMPIELFEIYQHISIERVAILLVNIVIVAYLVREVRRKKA